MSSRLCSALVCFIAVNAFAIFHGGQFSEVKGGMNWFTLSGGQPADYVAYSEWGVSDLQAITSDNLTFELKPNISAYANATTPGGIAEWRNGTDGNRWMQAITFRERFLDGRETGASFTFSVDEWGDLDSRYTVKAFIQLLDPDADYAVIFQLRDEFTITGVTGDRTLSLNFGTSRYSGKLLQAGFSMEGINANPDDDWGSVTVTTKEMVVNIPDSVRPSPSPMQFSIPPMAISDHEIEMTATNATDDAYGVEYYFICDTDRDLDSGWQDSPYHRASGLASEMAYTFRVTARDTSPSQNIAEPSGEAIATTLVLDIEPPTPNPAQISGTAVTHNAVTLTAVTAVDGSAVEYKFTNVSGGGSHSDWQADPVYTDVGLLPGSVYAYTVQARDLSTATNTTASSGITTVVTDTEVPSLVLIPNGDFENGGDQWTNAEADVVTLIYTNSGGSGDNGGYARHGRNPGTAWAVLVNPTVAGKDGGGIPLSSLFVDAGDTVTFAMDHINFSGSAVPMLKVEAWGGMAENAIDLFEVPTSVASEWTTFTYDWQLPLGTDRLIFVPVAGTNSVHGYDNIGIIFNHPDAAQIQMADVAEDGSFSFEIEGVEGETYVVQWKEHLSDTGWHTTMSTNGVGTLNLALPVDTDKDQLFYRVISTF